MSYQGGMPPGQGYPNQLMYGGGQQQHQQHQQQMQQHHQQQQGFPYQQQQHQQQQQYQQQAAPQQQQQYSYSPHQQQHGFPSQLLQHQPQQQQQQSMYDGQNSGAYRAPMAQQWQQQSPVQPQAQSIPQQMPATPTNQYNGMMQSPIQSHSSVPRDAWAQQSPTQSPVYVQQQVPQRMDHQQQMRRQSLQQQATQYSQQQQFQQMHQQSPQPSPQPQFQQFQQQQPNVRPSPQPTHQPFYNNASPSPHLQQNALPSTMVRNPSMGSAYSQHMPQSPMQRLPSHSQSPQIQHMQQPRQPSLPPQQAQQQRRTSQPPQIQRQSSIPAQATPPQQYAQQPYQSAQQQQQQSLPQRQAPVPVQAPPVPEPQAEPEILPDPPMDTSEQDSADQLLLDAQLQPEQMSFVSMQDLQMPSALPPSSMDSFMSIDPRDLSLSGSLAPAPIIEPLSLKTKIKEEPDVPMVNSTPIAPPPPISEMKIKTSPHSSIQNSPSITQRSPSITKRSPSVAPKPRPFKTIPIMVAIAEECLEKARSASHDIAMCGSEDAIEEYQKLISTALTCFETALDSSRLTPREEARLRLRYATVVQEETENVMEAETALTKGVSLCDKHRLFDLKYCLQYAMLKTLFQRNQKAGLKAVDTHIANCEAFKHVHWYYAFRLLKASFYHETGHSSDTSALENLRAIQDIANVRGDVAMSVLASLLEGLTLLKTEKEGNLEKVHSCLAQAAKYQLDPSVKIMELDVLTMILDFAASLHHQNPELTTQKLRKLQKALDECEDWHNVRADFTVPVKKQSSSAKTVSEDTEGIIRPGDADASSDLLVMSFMTKMELRSLVFTFSGLASFHKPSSQGQRTTELWSEGLKILDTWDKSTAGIPYGPPVPLNTAIQQRQWRLEHQVYLHVLMGLLASSQCQWAKVNMHLDKLEDLITESTQPTLRLLGLYLKGVHLQGTGNLQAALQTFLNEQLEIPQGAPASNKVGHLEVSLLAGLNRLWLMQHDSCRNDYQTQELIKQLQPLCHSHWNVDLRTAWHNVAAALVTEPPQQLNHQKQHIQAAMGGSKNTSNVVGAAVTLCIMRSRFFENVVGDQALKSARAAAKQAQRSGNMLWMSVADGMLAHSYDVQGQRDESKAEWEKATKEARQAFSQD